MDETRQQKPECQWKLQSTTDGVAEYLCPNCKGTCKAREGATLPRRYCDPEFVSQYEEYRKQYKPKLRTTPVARKPLSEEEIKEREEKKRKEEEEVQEAYERLGLVEKSLKWAAALLKWRRAGYPERSQEEVAEIYAICSAPCKYFYAEKQSCSVCGCKVSKDGMAVVNKARMATEKCPKGFWT